MSASSARVLKAMPPVAESAPGLTPAIRELLRVTDELKEAIKSLGRPDDFQSLTRREAAALLKVHPRQLKRLELLGLPSYKCGRGNTYVRHEVIAFRETLRNMAGLTIRIAKPHRMKVAGGHE